VTRDVLERALAEEMTGHLGTARPIRLARNRPEQIPRSDARGGRARADDGNQCAPAGRASGSFLMIAAQVPAAYKVLFALITTMPG